MGDKKRCKIFFTINTMDWIDLVISRASEGNLTTPTGPFCHKYRLLGDVICQASFGSYGYEKFVDTINNLEHLVDREVQRLRGVIPATMAVLLNDQDIRDIWSKYSQLNSNGSRNWETVLLFGCDENLRRACKFLYKLEDHESQEWWPHSVKKNMFGKKQLQRLWKHYL
jgi:hypothetical protein